MKIFTKKTVLSIPIVGNFVSVCSAIVRLPKKNREIHTMLNEIIQSVQNVKAIGQVEKDRIEEQMQSLAIITDNLSQKIILNEKSKLLKSDTDRTKAVENRDQLFASDHLADVFYSKFEDEFRGNEELITARLKEDYLPLFEKSTMDYKKYPVLDIGNGRGEFLSLMKSKNIRAHGIDINIDMVERAVQKGLDSQQGDAVVYLEKSKPQSIGAITGFHIVEHIPFNELLRLFSAAHTALKKDGFVLFETPNPENILVSTHTFYLDPSHLNPLPPQLLEFTMHNIGFRDVKILRLHPWDSPESKEDKGRLPVNIQEKIYGPRDYAVIAYK